MMDAVRYFCEGIIGMIACVVISYALTGDTVGLLSPRLIIAYFIFEFAVFLHQMMRKVFTEDYYDQKNIFEKEDEK